MSQLISEIIATGGRALEEEEQWQRSVQEGKGEAGGILGVNVICFHPYVFIRAILTNYRAKHAFTVEGRRVGELKVKIQKKQYFFIVDFWKDEPLAPLQESVERLAKQKAEACLIVLSANRYGETESRLRLIDGLAGLESREGVYRFGAKTDEGEDVEFWVGGWKVEKKPKGATAR
ncbi:MAG TPA: hypothetical protein VFE63_05535 [Roseiarcus sp.]|jgi:hypothetical protein|nr:hypothetical protein [Roseiarcus sp.]